MKNKKTIYNSDEFRKTVQCLTEKIREADELESVDVDKSFQDVMKRVGREKKVPHRRHIYRWSLSIAAAIALALVMNWWSTNVDEGTELDIALLNDTTSICGDEVILITDNQAMNLKNDASLKYDTLGSSNIQQYALNTKISQASSVKNEMHQIMVPNGKRADITFSDGTRIYINSGSKVIYPDIFEERKREILVEGEVYLDVAKRKDCPFVVKTREFDIRVLGTSFNVCAYREDEAASVVLVRGSVEVTTENKSKVRLAPNQLVDIKGNKTQVRKVDVSEYISWKDNLLLLHQRPVGDVLKKLERYYGCKIRYDAEIMTLSLSGKLDLQTDITNVMDNLCLSLSLHYTINDKDEIYVSLK